MKQFSKAVISTSIPWQCVISPSSVPSSSTLTPPGQGIHSLPAGVPTFLTGYLYPSWHLHSIVTPTQQCTHNVPSTVFIYPSSVLVILSFFWVVSIFFPTDLCFVYIWKAVTLTLQIFYSVVCLLAEVVFFNKFPISSYPEVMNLVLRAVLVKHIVWRVGQPSISESRNSVELLRCFCCRMLDR